MAAIGGISCSKVVGNPRLQQERIESFEIPGTDGVGVHLFGKGDGRWQVELVLYDSGANVDAWYLLITALVGTLVTVVNDWGTTTTDVLVSQVGELRKTPAIGEGGCRGSCAVLLQSMS